MIQYEYFNARLLQNTALKIQETVGAVTPPEGYSFGVLSALTNLETVSSTLVQNYNAVFIHTLGVQVPTEEAVEAFIREEVAGAGDNITINKNSNNELPQVQRSLEDIATPLCSLISSKQSDNLNFIYRYHPCFCLF